MPIARTKGGFALVYMLIFGVLVLMLTSALLAVGEQSLRTTRGGVDQSRALYAAEAGLAQAMAQLEHDPTWSAGFPDPVALPGQTASYRMRFAPGPSGGEPTLSYNNLLGEIAVDSYHGSASLPPHSALLVVTGSSGAASRTLEALVVSGVNVSETQALLATGKIELQGEVEIDGRQSLDAPLPRPAGIHHNDLEGGLKVHYAGGPDERLSVSGRVTSAARAPTSEVILFDTPHTPPASASNMPLQQLPRPNIAAMLDDHAHLSGPTVPLVGSLVLTDPDTYYGSDLTINGDLVLEDGAKLYVRGKLSVNGSVRGRGALIVGGETHLYGDVDVAARQKHYVSLLSQGSVVLKGFQGESYMRALTGANPTEAERWEDLIHGLKTLQQTLAEGPGADPNAFLDYLEDHNRDVAIDKLLSLIAYHPLGAGQDPIAFAIDPARTPPSPAPSGRPRHLFNSLHFLDTIPPGAALSSERFLRERFQLLDDWFRQLQYQRDRVLIAGLPGNPSLLSQHLEQYDIWDRAVSPGRLDAVASIRGIGELLGPLNPVASQSLQDMHAAIQQLDADRPGNAYFRGLVYTSGAFVALDDVSVQGAVIVNGDPAQAALILDGREYLPGQVGLYGHTRLTRVEDLFEAGQDVASASGALDVKRWTSR